MQIIFESRDADGHPVPPQPIQAIIQEAQHYDLLVIGAAPRNWRGDIRADSFVAKVTRNIGITSLVVRARQNLFGSLFSFQFLRR